MDKLSLLAATDVLYYFPSLKKKCKPFCPSFRDKILRGPVTYLKTFNQCPSDGTRIHVLSAASVIPKTMSNNHLSNNLWQWKVRFPPALGEKKMILHEKQP